AGVSATSPRGTGTPKSFSSALAWYSWICTSLLAGDLAEEPQDRVVVPVDHALLERDDAVVGDVDVLRADLGAALGDVAEADPGHVADHLPTVEGVQRVHLQFGQPDEEAGPGEALLLLVVVPDDVADVLAQEALDALPELLPAVDVLLHHPVGAVRLRGSGLEGGDAPGHRVVEADVGHQILDEREGPERRHADRRAGREEVHPGHAGQAGLAVHLGAAGAALAGLAVPPDRQVVGLGGLDPVEHIEDDHPLLVVHAVLPEVPARGVAAEDVHHRFHEVWPFIPCSLVEGPSGTGRPGEIDENVRPDPITSFPRRGS